MLTTIQSHASGYIYALHSTMSERIRFQARSALGGVPFLAPRSPHSEEDSAKHPVGVAYRLPPMGPSKGPARGAESVAHAVGDFLGFAQWEFGNEPR